MNNQRRRVLLIGEAVTLSHVVRPAQLARALDPALYDVTLAFDPRYNAVLGDLPFHIVPIKSVIPQENLLEVLKGHQSMFDVPTLDAYVQEDLRLIEEFRPDVVVGDMRQSLAISGPMARVPYLNIVNAQWSPYANLDLEIPDNPLKDLIGKPFAPLAHRLTAPFAFAPHTMPLNVIRLKYGLPPFGWDIKQIFTLGDYVAYPDIPEIVPTSDLPATHSYLGPILWSPSTPLPDWWSSLDNSRPIVYVNLGSSGQQALLSFLLGALSSLPVTVIAATARRVDVATSPANAYLADYLPGEEVSRRASLVVCNGGNMSTQQALACGTPILGIVSNVDQMAFAKAVSTTGAGEQISEREVTAPEVRRLVWRMIAQETYSKAAGRIAACYARMDSQERFRNLISEITMKSSATSA